MGSGETAPNPADEAVNFDTTVLSLRYGFTRRINITATIPYLSIESAKFQGAPYTRLNRGLGDLVVTGQYRFGTSPQLLLESGVKFATGSVDKKDELGQRICDILALGSGTTDFIVGMGLWVPNFFVHGLDLTASLRHKFSGGQNKWGYEFGDQTSYSVHGSRPFFTQARFGLRLDGYHAAKDTWYGNVVPERGATFLYAGPTASWRLSDTMTIGGYARFPVVMRLEGSQMVSPLQAGIEFTADVGALVKSLIPNDGGDR